HSERERPEVTAADHELDGLQMWMALPEDQEEIDPAFYHYPGDDIPRVEVDGVAVRVLMGSAYGVTSPVKVFAQTLYLEAWLQPGQRLSLPDAEERAVYVAKGSLQVGDVKVPTYSMIVLNDENGVVIVAVKEARIAVIGGERFSVHLVGRIFVSSSKERIEQAQADWREGCYPSIPGDAQEFISLR